MLEILKNGKFKNILEIQKALIFTLKINFNKKCHLKKIYKKKLFFNISKILN